MIEANGGIKANNIDRVVYSGAEVIVPGSGIFNTPDYAQTIQQVRKAVGLALEACCFLASVCYFERVGAWLSLVERTVRDREVGGSNPLAPTNEQRRLPVFLEASVFVH